MDDADENVELNNIVLHTGEDVGWDNNDQQTDQNGGVAVTRIIMVRWITTHNHPPLLVILVVDNRYVPKINMEFDSVEKVEEFYEMYAKKAGFGTRNASTNYNTA
ncbi:hypothetical protein C1H46_024578 [Malus baccata]|uniref:Protein FAR1-RELATED SEQUENCE n=1 Tax=Malus baccata TaxID=106549 RepID=A0A540LTZ9_MALBA|nr:hypothetical protein C1H46_024578 [Malus baccata]